MPPRGERCSTPRWSASSSTATRARRLGACASALVSRAARICTTSARAPSSSPPRSRSWRCAASTSIRGEVASLPAGAARVEQALDAIWGWFTGPLFLASIDLAAAARTDEELRAQLAPVEARLSQGTLLCCREMLAERPGGPQPRPARSR